MPHDIMPPELSLDDPELDASPSHNEKESPLLGAMKKAGRALVRTAKRAGRKQVLSAMMMAGAALCAPHAAKGQGCIDYTPAGLPYTCGGSSAPAGGPAGTTGTPPPGQSGGDPVNIASGNVFLHVVDYTTAGPNPLQLIRYYNSSTQPNAVQTMASGFYGQGEVPESSTAYGSATPGQANWRTNYDRWLQFSPAVSPTSVIVERPDGDQITFAWSGSAWVPGSTTQDDTLTQSGTTWTFTGHDDTVETYADSGSGWAQLSTITLRNGYTQTMSYSGTKTVYLVDGVYIAPPGCGCFPVATYTPGVVQSVTDSYGRSLSFTYTSGLLTSVSTPDSLVLSYGYTNYGNLGSYTGDAGSLLTSVSYNTSPATSQTYAYATTSAWPYEITSITDENGNTAVAWTYDSYGHATQSSQGGIGANTTSFSYSSSSTTVTNANGVSDTYNFTTYDGLPQVTSINRAAASPWTRFGTPAANEYFSADGNGFLSSFTDWNGNVTNYTNNSLGNPTQIVEGYGSSVARTTNIAYDATWIREPYTIATTGRTSTFTYDGSGNVATRTDTDTTSTSSPYSTNGQTREWQMTWNGTGELLTLQMPRTDTTVKYTLTWSSGALATITDQLSHEWQITSATGGGYPQTIVDPNSVTTTLSWDTRLNLNTRTVGGTYTTTWTHDPANNLYSVERPDGSTLTYTRDSANRVTNITDLPGNTINYTLDALGNPTEITLKDTSHTTQYINYYYFDKLGRFNSDYIGWSYTYDTNSNLTSVTDPQNSVTWNYTWDALNRPATKTDPSGGGTTTYTFDARNKLTNVQDPNGNSTSYVNDGFGNAIGVTSPDTGSTVYTYDKDRNLAQRVQNGGQTANLTWDAVDRNLTIAYPSYSSFNISKTYDQGGHGYGIGRLTSVTDQPGSDSFTYDERGNITGESRVLTSVGTLATSTSYDNANRVSSITYPSGTVASYTRNSMGLVTAISTTPPGGSATSIASSITNDPFGPVTGLTFGNGVTGSYSFYNNYTPAGRQDDTTGVPYITNLAYTYNADNSLHTITDSVNSINSQTLGYDYLQRLTSATSAMGGYGTYGWTWDANSNLATQVINSTTTTASLNSNTNQLASLAVTGGNTTTVDTTSNGNILDFKISGTAITSYTYGQDNRLASATGPLGASATYAYGFDGQRLLKTPSSGYPITYQYGLAAKEILAENDLHSGQTADYIYMDPGRNSTPVGLVNPSSGNVYYVHTDRQGTPQAVTDSGQNVVWSAFYNPFGDTSSFSGTLTTQSLRLPGQYFDPESGNNHNGFRDYSGALTRYIQSDPIGLRGGMNTYQYVKGNPFKYSDRLGLDPGGDNCSAADSNPANFSSDLFLNSQYGPASAVGAQYGVDPTLLLGLAALESGWGSSSMYRNQMNPFGATPGGDSTRGLGFSSFSAGWGWWGKTFGPRVYNVGSDADAFVGALLVDNRGNPNAVDQRGAYNSENSDWGDDVAATADSVGSSLGGALAAFNPKCQQ